MDKAFSDRIHANVEALFREFIVVADAMVEEIALPVDAIAPRGDALPGGNDVFHHFGNWKRKQSVDVVRHHQKQHGKQALQCGWTPKAASAGEGPESQTLTMKVRKITAAFLDPMATILRKKLNPEPENAW